MVLSEGCSHHEESRAALAEAMAEAGIEGVEVQETQIRADEEAIGARCIGSPTIRVNGFDVEYMEREPEEKSNGCRYFNTPAGWKPYPEKGMIVRALERAQQLAENS
jgi:hypothetical protein